MVVVVSMSIFKNITVLLLLCLTVVSCAADSNSYCSLSNQCVGGVCASHLCNIDQDCTTHCALCSLDNVCIGGQCDRQKCARDAECREACIIKSSGPIILGGGNDEDEDDDTSISRSIVFLVLAVVCCCVFVCTVFQKVVLKK